MALLIPGVGLVDGAGTLLIPGAGLVESTPELVTLAVADTAHGHVVDNLALIQAHVLAVADALHGHTADGADLIQQSVLIVDDALHAHLVDQLSLLLLGDEVAGTVFVIEARDRVYLVAAHSRAATVPSAARIFSVH